jgi:hypothetical protein
MPWAEVFLYRVCTFDNGILMQHPWRDLQSCFSKEGGFISLFMKREKKGRCFFRLRLKKGMYEDFTPHKEIYYIIKHIDSR